MSSIYINKENKNGYGNGYISNDDGYENTFSDFNANQDFFIREYFLAKKGTIVEFTSKFKQGVNTDLKNAVYIHVYGLDKRWKFGVSNETTISHKDLTVKYEVTEDCYVRFMARGFTDCDHTASISVVNDTVSRLEKFIYAICSMDVSDLPVPLSRIETLWNCLITGETPDFEPLSRNEKYLMAMLDRYDISNLPAPMSRGEKLLYKIAVGETDLSDVPDYLSRYEELLKYLIENGGISGGDFEYVLYTLNQSLHTLYLTAEKPVKSAILKGNTLVNLVDQDSYESGSDHHLYMNLKYKSSSNIYTIINYSNKTIQFVDDDKKYVEQVQPYSTYILNSDKFSKVKGDSGNGWVSDGTFQSSVVVLEGDWSDTYIPYFEGMQSVKMPVLKTTGKNLFDMNIMGTSETRDGWTYERTENLIHFTSDGTKAYQQYSLDITNHLVNEIKLGKPYSFTSDISKNITNDALSICQLMITNKDGSKHYYDTPRVFTLNKEFSKIDIRIIGHNYNEVGIPSDYTIKNIQLEEGSVATSCEPYKSNILSCNEEVELRGIGDVKDELDCLTGQVTERIGEVTFKGALDERWGKFDNSAIQEKTCLFAYYNGLPSSPSENLKMICDKFNIAKDGYFALLNTDEEMIHVYSDSAIYFRILKSKLSTQNEDGFKKWLSYNPFTIQYQLATESIKTVDLTVVDQDNQPTELGTFENVTHVSLEAENLIPEVEMEVATNLLEDTVFNLTDAFNTLYPTAAKPVKSAILKGNTLVNIFQDMDYVWNNLTKQDSFNYNGDLIILNNGYYDGRYWESVPKIPNIKSNTEYTMIFTKGSSPCGEIGTVDENGRTSVLKRYDNAQKVKITSPNNGDVRVKFCVENPKSDKSVINLGKVMFIEGDYTNVDIPYFEGMQSVKMPVLTTSNEDDTKSNILTTPYDLELRGIGDVQDMLDCLTGELTESIGEIVLDGNSDIVYEPDDGDFYIQLNTLAKISGDYSYHIISDKGKVLYYHSDIRAYEGTDLVISGYHDWGVESWEYPGENWLYFAKKDITSESDMKAWLAQNPVAICYKLAEPTTKSIDISTVDQDGNVTTLKTFDDTTHVLLNSEGLIPTAVLTVRTKIPSGSSTSLLMNDISTEQQQLETTVDEQSENVDATMIATTEIFEETL